MAATKSNTPTTTTGGSGSPCGACKFLRRKCAAECVFAPYFASEQGPSRFAAIHKVFGASNASKLLSQVPVVDRCEAVVTIAYEAQARIRDPVYGCVSHIFALQQQVAYLEAQLMKVKAQLAQNLEINNITSRGQLGNIVSSSGTNINNINYSNIPQNSSPSNCYYYNTSPISPQSSLDSVDHNIFNNNNKMSSDDDDVMMMHGSIHEAYYGTAKKRPYNNELGELQALALRMMGTYN